MHNIPNKDSDFTLAIWQTAFELLNQNLPTPLVKDASTG